MPLTDGDTGVYKLQGGRAVRVTMSGEPGERQYAIRYLDNGEAIGYPMLSEVTNLIPWIEAKVKDKVTWYEIGNGPRVHLAASS